MRRGSKKGEIEKESECVSHKVRKRESVQALMIDSFVTQYDYITSQYYIDVTTRTPRTKYTGGDTTNLFQGHAGAISRNETVTELRGNTRINGTLHLSTGRRRYLIPKLIALQFFERLGPVHVANVNAREITFGIFLGFLFFLLFFPTKQSTHETLFLIIVLVLAKYISRSVCR
jgi:hypothetical protein